MNTRSKAFFGYLLLVHLSLALVLWKSNFIEKVSTTLGITKSDKQSFYQQMTTVHTIMDSSVPDDSVVFIGDSITQALATTAISTPTANYGIYSDNTQGVINRLPLYQSIKRARVVVLAIGVNDIHQHVDQSDTLLNYKTILKSIPIDVHIIVSSILPIGPIAQTNAFNNAHINALNNQIKLLTNEYKNATFLDNMNDFIDKEGYLRSSFHIGDGVHLSNEGYSVLIDNIAGSLSAIED